MTQKHKVLIADDDKSLLRLLKLMLEDIFDLVLVEDGDAAKQQLLTQHYDFVLLDIHLPGVDGLGLCELVAEADLSPSPPVIVLSADKREEVIRSAYQLGVNDYIIKPFNVAVFHEHILRFSKDLRRIRAIEEHDKRSQSIAETAMRQSAFYGQAIELMSDLNQCQNEPQMAKMVMDSLKLQGIHTALQLRSSEALFNYDSDHDRCSEIELQVFELLKERGRVYEFGRRAVFNDRNVSLLVKAMPVKSSTTYGILVDLIAKLLPALQARLKSIQAQARMQSAGQALHAMMQIVDKGVAELDSEVRSVLDNIETHVGQSFHQLELQEHQERFFLDLIDNQLRAKLNGDKYLQLQDKIASCLGTLMLDEVAIPPAPIEATANIEVF